METFRPVHHWLAYVLVLLIASPVVSEEIELVSGEVLKDVTILERTPEVFIVQHTILGRLEIPITSIRTVNGRPVATILVPTNSVQETKTAEPPAGESPPPTPPRVTDPQDTTPSTANPPVVNVDPEPSPKPRVPWKSQLEFGGAVTDGSSDTSNFAIKFLTIREIPTKIRIHGLTIKTTPSPAERFICYRRTGRDHKR